MKAINKKSVEHPGIILRQVTTGILRFQCPPQVRTILGEWSRLKLSRNGVRGLRPVKLLEMIV